jgi:hypothetical protein
MVSLIGGLKVASPTLVPTNEEIHKEISARVNLEVEPVLIILTVR